MIETRKIEANSKLVTNHTGPVTAQEGPSELAPSENAGPSGSLRCDGVVGPLSREEILTLKIAEHVLMRDMLDTAIRSLLRGVRPAGTSKYQNLVLADHLEELERRANDSMNIKWPNTREMTRTTE